MGVPNYNMIHDKEFFAMIADSPAVYAQTYLGKKTQYPWQRAVKDAVAKDKSNVSAVTCNESGKTSECIHDLVLWHMDTRPGSITVTTSASVRQVRNQLYPHLQSTCARNPYFKDWKVTTGTQLSVTSPNGSKCVSFVAVDPGKAEGFHKAEFGTSDVMENFTPPEEWNVNIDEIAGNAREMAKSLMIIVDEAKTVPDEIFEAIDRCRPDHYFVASSPGDPHGFFYDTQHRNRKEFKIFTVPWSKCPHLFDMPAEHAQIERRIRTFGEDSAYVRSSCHAEWVVDAGALVFNRTNLSGSFAGKLPKFGHDRCLAIDLSGGGDEIPCFFRQGNHGKVEYSTRNRDSYDLVKNELVPLFRRLKLAPEEICADNGGLGKPIIDHCHALKWPIRRIDFGGKPKDNSLYANVRAEMYWEFSHRVNAGEAILDSDKLLEDQLLAQKYDLSQDRCMRLIRKEKLKGAMPWNSPDRSDAAVMAFYDAPRAHVYRSEEIKHNRQHSPTWVDPHKEEAYASII